MAAIATGFIEVSDEELDELFDLGLVWECDEHGAIEMGAAVTEDDIYAALRAGRAQ